MNKPRLGFWSRAVMVLGVALVACVSYGAVTGVEAVPLSISKSGNVTVTQYGNGACDVKIASQNLTGGYPNLQDCHLKAEAATANGAFIGNYSKVAGMSFRVMKTSGEMPKMRLMLQGQPRPVGSGALWKYEALKVSDAGGVWVINNVPMNRASGWSDDVLDATSAFTEEQKDAFWAQDLRNVQYVVLVVDREGYDEVVLKIDDFVLKDANGFVVGTVTLTPLEVALLDRFGVTSVADLTDAQKKEQTIAKGISDVDVILARFDPNYYASVVFKAYVEQVPPEGVLVKWLALEGKRYTVNRKDSVTGTYTPVWTSGPAAQNGWMEWRETQAGGPYFYRIVCED